ncbi:MULTISPECIES: ketopantoate hydroxymethyltransferase [unclassified Paenibacillus]|uniref:ketopantoate hydroxymethyltransferase n=1 Tax=unclassified Paenibacillus TaxID=185978 RepID=UPI00119E5D29|nr:ketopantoate hydroxymethyltransferase [Paenibacillus sp. 32O-W]
MITTHLLNEVAKFTDSKIAKIVLNGTYEITSFTSKQAENNEVILNYMVPFGSVETITLIELKQADNRVLSSNQVYVPVTTDTIMVQTIEVKEG